MVALPCHDPYIRTHFPPRVTFDWLNLDHISSKVRQDLAIWGIGVVLVLISALLVSSLYFENGCPMERWIKTAV